jgi:hypothetical protein
MSAIQHDDAKLNMLSGLTCRVWVLRVWERLREGRFMDFDSLEALEREAFEFGNTHLESADAAFQPRPLVDSRVCKV